MSANKTTQKQASEENETPRSHVVAQKSLDDVCARIVDNPKTSLATRLSRAIRAGLSPDAAEAALGAVQEAVADARAVVARAQEGQPEAPSSRATLIS